MRETAVIYVKDNIRKIEQKLFCQMYALENNLDVLYVTSNLDEVRDCDVLLIARPNMISRDVLEYYSIVDSLKENGIEVRIVLTEENSDRYLNLISREFKRNKVK